MVLRTGFRGSSALVLYLYLCLDKLCWCLAFLPHPGVQLPGWYAVRQKRSTVLSPALYTTADFLSRNCSGGARLEDRQAPVEHKALYESLNGDIEDHGATAVKGKERKNAPEFNGVKIYDVAEWVRVFGGHSSQVAAVYEVIGRDGTPSYIGMSRHVGIALQCHQHNEPPHLVSRVRVKSFWDPKRVEMEALRAEWIAAAGSTPIGNREGNEWLNFIRDAAKAFKQKSTQDSSYKEHKKPETHKAMADNASLVDKLGPIDSSGLDGGDRIQERNVDETPAKVENTATLQRTLLPLEDFTVETVDKALDKIRPYLISDGGNCRVLSVDAVKGSVDLMLVGACESCPSSTTTIKMVIEQALRERWPGLQKVREANGPAAALDECTAGVVENIIASIKEAIQAMGGKVEIRSVEDGVVQLALEGNPKLRQSIQWTCLNNPLIQEINFVDF